MKKNSIHNIVPIMRKDPRLLTSGNRSIIIKNMIEQRNKWISILSIIVYLCSMFCVTYYTSHDASTYEYHSETDNIIYGYHFMLIGLLSFPFDLFCLLIGTFRFTLIWFVNIVYIYCIFAYFKNRHKLLQYFLISSSIVLLIIFESFHNNISGRDDINIDYIGAKGLGYYLWIIGTCLLLLARLKDDLLHKIH